MNQTKMVFEAGTPLTGRLFRLVRLRSRRAAAGADANDATSTRWSRPDHAPEEARSPMDAGLTRGASLFFGGGR